MHRFAVLPIKPLNVSENQMECRFPPPTLYCLTEKEGFGLAGKQGLSTGIWRIRNLPDQSAELERRTTGSRELGVRSRWNTLGWDTCRRTRARARTVNRRDSKAICDAHF